MINCLVTFHQAKSQGLQGCRRLPAVVLVPGLVSDFPSPAALFFVGRERPVRSVMAVFTRAIIPGVLSIIAGLPIFPSSFTRAQRRVIIDLIDCLLAGDTGRPDFAEPSRRNPGREFRQLAG